MTIDNFKQHLQKAMQERDMERAALLRLLIAELNNAEIAKRPGQMNEDDVTSVLQKEAKKRRESIEAYQKGNRQDLVDAETIELGYIREYLPAQMTKEEVKKVVKDIVSNLGDKANFGAVMSQAMARLKGKADGKIVVDVVKKELSNPGD